MSKCFQLENIGSAGIPPACLKPRYKESFLKKIGRIKDFLSSFVSIRHLENVYAGGTPALPISSCQRVYAGETPALQVGEV